ncbi:MAG TPA: TIGR03619 family F420-dependent LLM class oxidoreductase [Candidatus Limnocylindrales bacterium]|nr:TIGR03619 family F420-dependent LLM class oxidoreductase [Candidatus Limnocylindrales bacterium]
MDYGLALPNIGFDANVEGLVAAAELAERHGFSDIWATDHLLVTQDASEDYGRTYEAITTLAWLAAKSTTVKLGTSVIVVPMRNSVVVAKQLATLDALSGGRVIAGFGVGWSEDEFANIGASERFHQRGAYTEETVALCRHLWSGTAEPFEGRFFQFSDFVFQPLPDQGAALPIWLGGRDERALRRVGRVADAYHASATSPASYAPRIPVIREAAEAAGRPMPRLSARTRIELGKDKESFYTIHGSAEEAAAEIRAFADLGVDHLVLMFPSRDAAVLARDVERFVAEVKPLV